jgi:hypothetical protein
MKVGKSFFFYGWKKLADNSPTKLPVSLLLFFVRVCFVIFSKRDTSLSLSLSLVVVVVVILNCKYPPLLDKKNSYREPAVR